jgi:hypothetical protein
MSTYDSYTVRELAIRLGVHPSVVIERLMEMDVLATVHQRLPGQLVEKLLDEFQAR